MPRPEPLDDLTAFEERLRRRDGLRVLAAFAGAVLLHSSTALGLTYWTPPEPVSPPGEMVITVDLAPAVTSTATEPSSGQASESAPQEATPPTPEPVAEEKPVVEQPVPEPKEEVAETPPAEKPEVDLAPEKTEPQKQKPKPKPSMASQAAAASRETTSDVGGSGASASPSEINEYAGRVRAAIERRKHKPASAGSASGIAYLSFSITRSGGVAGLKVSKSSGNPALDDAARSAVASAGIPPIPPGLPAPMAIGVPMRFAR